MNLYVFRVEYANAHGAPFDTYATAMARTQNAAFRKCVNHLCSRNAQGDPGWSLVSVVYSHVTY